MKTDKRKGIKDLIVVFIFALIAAIILEHFWGGISFVIGFLYEIFSYSTILNVVVMLFLGIAFFLIFRKNPETKKLVIATLILFAIPIGFIAMQTYNLYEVSDKTVIIIAEFDDKKATTKADVSKRIYDSLNKEKAELNLASLQIEKNPKIIQSNEEAQREGNKGIKKKAKTVIVIWGWYDDIDINTFFTVVKSPKKEIMEDVELEKVRGLTIAELKNFDLTYIRKTLPDAIVFFTDFTIGMVYYSEENYDGAIVQFKASLEKLPEDEERSIFILHLARVYFHLGNSYWFRNDLISAEREYRKLMALNPKCAEPYYNFGLLLLFLEKYEEAEEEYKKAMCINPEFAEAHYHLGILYEYNDERIRYGEGFRINDAIEEYRKAININPNYAEAHYNLGVLLAKLKRYDEAEEEYRKAININHEYAKAHYDLGLLLHKKLERYDEAEEEYRKAIEINPEYAEAHNNLGVLLYDFKKYKEAEEEYRKAIKINSGYAEAHGNLGILLVLLKRYNEAEKEHKIAHKLFLEQGKIEDAKKVEKLLNLLIQSNLSKIGEE